jgi:hypothetical protein
MKATPRRAASVPAHQRPLWTCPRCGNLFVTRNLWHSCVRYTLDHHFRGKPRARALFDRFRKVLGSFGPVRMVVSKTRIAFMVRVRFAGVTRVRPDSLRCSIWLTRRVASKRWTRVDRYAPKAYVYQFDVREPRDLDAEIRRFLRESYAVGCQLHRVAGPG